MIKWPTVTDQIPYDNYPIKDEFRCDKCHSGGFCFGSSHYLNSIGTKDPKHWDKERQFSNITYIDTSKLPKTMHLRVTILGVSMKIPFDRSCLDGYSPADITARYIFNEIIDVSNSMDLEIIIEEEE